VLVHARGDTFASVKRIPLAQQALRNC